jgi:PAS domain-containing protein
MEDIPADAGHLPDLAGAQRVAVKFEIYYEPYGQWFEAEAFPVKNGGLAEYARNITERKRGEQAALQLAAIVTSSDDAIVGKTLEGAVVSWNAGAKRMFGYSESEMLGRSISTLVPPELPDDTAGILERIRRGERVEHHETVHALKIDQTFVRDIGTDPNDTELIKAIIAMANSLHLKAVAEGVETWQQAQFLLANGCLAGQGFYYSKAVPADALLRWWYHL